MLAMPRLSGSAAALIAALASYRPLPNPPRRAEATRRADRNADARRAARRDDRSAGRKQRN